MDSKRKKNESSSEDTSPSDDEQFRKRMKSGEDCNAWSHYDHEVEQSQSMEAQDSPPSTASECSPGHAGYFSYSPGSQASYGGDESHDGSTDSSESLEGHAIYPLRPTPELLNKLNMTWDQFLRLFFQSDEIEHVYWRTRSPRPKLPHINHLADAIHLLETCSNILIVTGAGVSVSCGIPDFRSENGIYARLRHDFPDLPNATSMFDLKYFEQNPRPFFKFAQEIYPGQYRPSPCHYFIKTLEDKGKLLRNYTQNIDTLEQVAGITRIVQCHGSFATATCLKCGYNVSSEAIKDAIFSQTVPHCPRCPEEDDKAIMKPDIVFFHEKMPPLYHDSIDKDKTQCDLLIVIGSSLKVNPVGLIPQEVEKSVPQILINREPLRSHEFDVELLGDCDVITTELLRRLSWKSALPDAPEPRPLTELTRESMPPEAHKSSNMYRMIQKISQSASPSNVSEEEEEEPFDVTETLHDLFSGIAKDVPRAESPRDSSEGPGHEASTGGEDLCKDCLMRGSVCNACRLLQRGEPPASEHQSDDMQESSPVPQPPPEPQVPSVPFLPSVAEPPSISQPPHVAPAPSAPQEGTSGIVSPADRYSFYPIQGAASSHPSHTGGHTVRAGCPSSSTKAVSDSRTEDVSCLPPLHQECTTDTEDECYHCKRGRHGKGVKQKVKGHAAPHADSGCPESQPHLQPGVPGQPGGQSRSGEGPAQLGGATDFHKSSVPESSGPAAEGEPSTGVLSADEGNAPPLGGLGMGPLPSHRFGGGHGSSPEHSPGQDPFPDQDASAGSAQLETIEDRMGKIPMSEFLPEDTFVFVPPNRYIFANALVYHLGGSRGCSSVSSEASNDSSSSSSSSSSDTSSSSSSRSHRTPSSDSGLPQDAEDVTCPPAPAPSGPQPQSASGAQDQPLASSACLSAGTQQVGPSNWAANTLPQLQPWAVPHPPLPTAVPHFEDVQNIPLPPGTPPPPNPYVPGHGLPALDLGMPQMDVQAIPLPPPTSAFQPMEGYVGGSMPPLPAASLATSPWQGAAPHTAPWVQPMTLASSVTTTTASGREKDRSPPNFLPLHLDGVVPMSDTDADTPTELSRYLCDGGSSTPNSAESLIATLHPSLPQPASPDR